MIDSNAGLGMILRHGCPKINFFFIKMYVNLKRNI